MVQILHVTVGPETRGHGTFPAHDPWGNAFSRRYHPDRFAKAGTPIGGYLYYCGILEGIQSDLDFLRCMFDLQRTSARQVFCHLCDSLQWLSLKNPIGPLNNLESLYTVYGPREGDAKIISKEDWVQIHGSSPICEIIGWDPERTLPTFTVLPFLVFLELGHVNTESKPCCFSGIKKNDLRTISWLHAHHPPRSGSWFDIQCATRPVWAYAWKHSGRFISWIVGVIQAVVRFGRTFCVLGVNHLCKYIHWQDENIFI